MTFAPSADRRRQLVELQTQLIQWSTPGASDFARWGEPRLDCDATGARFDPAPILLAASAGGFVAASAGLASAAAAYLIRLPFRRRLRLS